MVEEANLKFRLRKTDETRNCILDDIKHNDFMRGKYKETCKHLNYVKNSVILASRVTGCVSTSTFASLVAILVGITSSSVEIKICAVSAGIKKYKSIIRKKKKKHNKIKLLGKDNLNTIESLFVKALIDPYIGHGEFVLVNNVLREYYEIKEETKNLETSEEYTI